jgi:hypothetical protein
MRECIPDAAGTQCTVCGWVNTWHINGWPRHNCSIPLTPEQQQAHDEAERVHREQLEADRTDRIVKYLTKNPGKTWPEIVEAIQCGCANEGEQLRQKLLAAGVIIAAGEPPAYKTAPGKLLS